MNVRDRAVWVTGASSGIGAALAIEFARRGARLVLSARSVEKLEEVRVSCARPELHRVVPLDLGNAATIEQAAEQVQAVPQDIDVLVHCGGISQRALATETTPEVLRRIMEVNYFGTVLLTQRMLPGMLERGRGRIVVVSSLVGKFGTPLRSAYSASKHALHGYFDSLRLEIWRQGVGITLACPGFVQTEVSINALTGDGTPQGTMDQATKKGISPEQCARTIVRAVERDRDEILVGGKEVFAVALRRFFPALFHRLMRRARVT